jgi:DNA-binding response OmpR family regulator
MNDETRGRILVVEDDPDAALFVMYVLARRGGFDVTHTADPATAIRLAASEPWDLVLTEAKLPGMTGLELLGALRRLAPGLPVAVLTGHVPADEALRGRADGYLTKPVGIGALIAAAVTLTARDVPTPARLTVRGNLRG